MTSKRIGTGLVIALGMLVAIAPFPIVDQRVQFGFANDYVIPLDSESAVLLQFRDGWLGMVGVATLLLALGRHDVRAVFRWGVVAVVLSAYGLSTFLRHFDSTCASIALARLTQEEMLTFCEPVESP